jgi:hypothetical protein
MVVELRIAAVDVTIEDLPGILRLAAGRRPFRARTFEVCIGEVSSVEERFDVLPKRVMTIGRDTQALLQRRWSGRAR